MIILHGRPATKKNSIRPVRCGRFTKILPSEAYEKYESDCLWQLKGCRERYTGPISVQTTYWMPNHRSWPDLVNLLSATHDILQKGGIIDNDKNIVSVDGSRIAGIDKMRPRVEIVIREVVL